MPGVASLDDLASPNRFDALADVDDNGPEPELLCSQPAPLPQRQDRAASDSGGDNGSDDEPSTPVRRRARDERSSSSNRRRFGSRSRSPSAGRVRSYDRNRSRSTGRSRTRDRSRSSSRGSSRRGGRGRRGSRRRYSSSRSSSRSSDYYYRGSRRGGRRSRRGSSGRRTSGRSTYRSRDDSRDSRDGAGRGRRRYSEDRRDGDAAASRGKSRCKPSTPVSASGGDVAPQQAKPPAPVSTSGGDAAPLPPVRPTLSPRLAKFPELVAAHGMHWEKTAETAALRTATRAKEEWEAQHALRLQSLEADAATKQQRLRSFQGERDALARSQRQATRALDEYKVEAAAQQTAQGASVEQHRQDAITANVKLDAVNKAVPKSERGALSEEAVQCTRQQRAVEGAAKAATPLPVAGTAPAVPGLQEVHANEAVRVALGSANVDWEQVYTMLSGAPSGLDSDRVAEALAILAKSPQLPFVGVFTMIVGSAAKQPGRSSLGRGGAAPSHIAWGCRTKSLLDGSETTWLFARPSRRSWRTAPPE